jgi:hypothetical protein
MDIFILREGHQTGPYSEEDTQQLLKQGAVVINDLAWCAGMAEWIPLHSILYPGPAAAQTAPPTRLAPPPPPKASEPATPKQRAFLHYMGLKVPGEITKDQAARAIADATENPKNAGRVAQWHTERLTLHPDLFEEEIKERKEQRIQHYFDVCQHEGAEYLQGITKAHCQVLVGYLDVKFPNWDANPTEAPKAFFFPAVAEKFPQLVRKEWQGKLKAPQGPKVAPELKRKAPMKPLASPLRKRSSPIGALIKGFLLGLVVVALAGAGIMSYLNPAGRDALIAKAKAQINALTGKWRGAATTPTPGTEPLEKEIEPSAGAEAANQPGIAPSSPPMASTAPERPAADSAPPAAPMAATPPAADGMMSASPPKATEPAASAAPPGGMSLFDPTPPAPANPPASGATVADAGIPAPKTSATLLRTIEVQSPYGKIKVPAGTQLPIVEQDGASLKVKFQNQVVAVAVSDTDLAAEAPPMLR